MAVLQTLDFRFSQIVEIFRSWIQRNNTIFWTFKFSMFLHKKLVRFCICWRRWKWPPLVGWIMMTLSPLLTNIHLRGRNRSSSLNGTACISKVVKNLDIFYLGENSWNCDNGRIFANITFVIRRLIHSWKQPYGKTALLILLSWLVCSYLV